MFQRILEQLAPELWPPPEIQQHPDFDVGVPQAVGQAGFRGFPKPPAPPSIRQ